MGRHGREGEVALGKIFEGEAERFSMALLFFTFTVVTALSPVQIDWLLAPVRWGSGLKRSLPRRRRFNNLHGNGESRSRHEPHRGRYFLFVVFRGASLLIL